LGLSLHGTGFLSSLACHNAGKIMRHPIDGFLATRRGGGYAARHASGVGEFLFSGFGGVRCRAGFGG
jgi:hypothetical protein